MYCQKTTGIPMGVKLRYVDTRWSNGGRKGISEKIRISARQTWQFTVKIDPDSDSSRIENFEGNCASPAA